MMMMTADRKKITTAAPLLLVAAFALVGGGAIIPTGVVVQPAAATQGPPGPQEVLDEAGKTATGVLNEFGLDEEADTVEDTFGTATGAVPDLPIDGGELLFDGCSVNPETGEIVCE